jgi:hypothetical protein
MTRPPTWSEVERALLGRAHRWAVATDLYRWERGYQVHLALEFLEDFLPYDVPSRPPGPHWDALPNSALADLAAWSNGTLRIQEVMTQVRLHVVSHLLHRQSLLRGRCLICDPPPGVSEVHCSRSWRDARDWTVGTPAVLEEMKKFILAGDQRRAEVDQLAAADGMALARGTVEEQR